MTGSHVYLQDHTDKLRSTSALLTGYEYRVEFARDQDQIGTGLLKDHPEIGDRAVQCGFDVFVRFRRRDPRSRRG